MKVYLYDEPITLKKDQMIGKGIEARVYKVNDTAYKVYKYWPLKKRLEKDEVLKLMPYTKETSNIILPGDLLYDKHNLMAGYTHKYIESTSDEIGKLNISEIINSLINVEHDIYTLSKNGFALHDFNHKNTVFNKGIYLIDSGSYTYLKGEKDLEKNNLEEFYKFIEKELISAIYNKKDLLSKKSRNNKSFIETELKMAIQKDLIEYFLQQEVHTNDTLEEFIKVKTR